MVPRLLTAVLALRHAEGEGAEQVAASKQKRRNVSLHAIVSRARVVVEVGRNLTVLWASRLGHE